MRHFPTSTAGRKSIDDQVVVVVGASSGIGRVTVRRLAERGASVVAAARSAADLASLLEECRSSPGTVVDVVADVTDQATMAATASAAVRHFGRIDTWVGVAGVGVYGRAWDTSAAEYDTVMRTNWLGQVHGALAAVPELRRSSGTLICIGSVESVRAVPLHAAYVSSKMALRGFCDSLRMDLDADHAGVAVSLVLPAAIDTPFFAHARSHLAGRPKPPPPVYTPDSVAAVILRMAQHPRREVVVGGSGLGFLAGQRLAPGLTDRLMTAGNSMLRAQQEPGPAEPADNLEAPVSGSGSDIGGHDGRRSLTSVLASARPAARRAAGLGAAAAGVAAGRVLARRPVDEPTHPRDVVTVPEADRSGQTQPAGQTEAGAR
jgi:short-subunit dehydrogenase